MSAPAAGLILAAGEGRRFGGQKLLAGWRGRPLLQHVVDAAMSAGLAPVIAVVGPAARVESEIDWRAAARIVNRAPEMGLSRSLQLGLAALPAHARRVLVLLGDQPAVPAGVIEALLGQPADEARPIVTPRYPDGRPGNPVLIERAAWPLAVGLTGDRGMSQLFSARPDLVRLVDVAGTNPDIDTPADLAALG